MPTTGSGRTALLLRSANRRVDAVGRKAERLSGRNVDVGSCLIQFIWIGDQGKNVTGRSSVGCKVPSSGASGDETLAGRLRSITVDETQSRRAGYSASQAAWSGCGTQIRGVAVTDMRIADPTGELVALGQTASSPTCSRNGLRVTKGGTGRGRTVSVRGNRRWMRV